MKIEQIKANSLIKVEFSTFFYSRLKDLALYITGLKTPDELKTIYEKVKNDQELEDYDQVLETMLILVNTIEQNAKQQNLTEEVELPGVNG